jgi:hypothetical protein
MLSFYFNLLTLFYKIYLLIYLKIIILVEFLLKYNLK